MFINWLLTSNRLYVRNHAILKCLLGAWTDASNDLVQFLLDVLETVLCGLKSLLHFLQGCYATAFFDFQGSNVSLESLDFISKMLLLVRLGCLAQVVFRMLQFTCGQLLIALYIQELRSRIIGVLRVPVYDALLHFKLREEYLSRFGYADVVMNSTDLNQYLS